MGHGAFILPDVVVTSWHVLQGAKDVVIHNSEGVSARILKGSSLNKRNVDLDLAIAEISRPLTRHPIFYGDTADYLTDMKGFLVHSYTGEASIHKVGIDPTRVLTDLALNGLGRNFLTDHEIGPGYSGSPVFDSRGRLSSILIGNLHTEFDNRAAPAGTFSFMGAAPHRLANFIRTTLDI